MYILLYLTSTSLIPFSSNYSNEGEEGRKEGRKGEDEKMDFL